MTEGDFSLPSCSTSAAHFHRWVEEVMMVQRAIVPAVSLFEHDWAILATVLHSSAIYFDVSV